MSLTITRAETLHELTEHVPYEISASFETIRSLVAVPGLDLDVRPGSSAGLWRITPGSVAGVATVPGIQLLIGPKIGIRNLLAIMDVGGRHERWADELFEYEREPDLLAAMVRLFIRSLERALAQGLRRDYVRRDERLAAIRGRIDLARAVRQPGVLMTLPCNYDDYTPDTGANRLLLAAVRRALQIPRTPAGVRRNLHRLELRFEDVDVDVDPLRWARSWVPNRLDRHYLPAVRIATLLLQNLSIKHGSGTAAAATFLVDMNKVVESFISERLRLLLEGRLEVRAQYPTKLDVGGRVDIRPDLVFLSSGRPSFIADVKYKVVEGVDDVGSHDFYQLLAYTTALKLPAGALITCLADRTKGDVEESVTVRGAEKRLEVWPLDLTGSRAEIEAGLQRLAYRIVQRTASSS